MNENPTDCKIDKKPNLDHFVTISNLFVNTIEIYMAENSINFQNFGL